MIFSIKNNKFAVWVLATIVVVLVFGLYLFLKDQSVNQHTKATTGIVTFFSENGIYLGKVTINIKNAAKPPEMPLEQPGKVFVGWDKDLLNIPPNSKEISTRAKYLDVSKDDNVIAMSAGYGTKGEDVILPLKIIGKVNLCAADITLSYNKEMLAYIGDEKTDKAVTIKHNGEPGLIYVRFASGVNASGEIDLAALKFKIISPKKSITDVKVMVRSALGLDGANKPVAVPYNVADARVYIY